MAAREVLSSPFIGQSFRNFIETIHSPDTRGAYKNSLSLYLKYRKYDTCDQLLHEDPKIIQMQLQEYVIYMRDELQVSKSTINNRLAAI